MLRPVGDTAIFGAQHVINGKQLQARGSMNPNIYAPRTGRSMLRPYSQLTTLKQPPRGRRGFPMARARQIYICLATLAALLGLCGPGGPSLARAQAGEEHAGLVLQFADGSVRDYCLAF